MRRISLITLFSLSFILTTSVAFADLTDGLVAHYPFNGNAYDESGNNNHGTIYGATLNNDRTDFPDSAYSFDGVNDYIKVNGSQFNFPQTLTLSIWVKPASKQLQYACIIDKCHSHNSNGGVVKSFCLQQSGSNNNAYIFHSLCGNSSCSYNAKSINPIPDKWNHILITAETMGGSIKYYLNGNFVADYKVSYQIATNGSLPLIIGNTNNWNRYYKGVIDDIRIYNRILSFSEIQELYTEKTSAVVSGCINMKNNPVTKGSAMLIQSGEFHQTVPLDINGCYKFYRVIEERPYSVIIRRNIE